jgi:hypothetical protein
MMLHKAIDEQNAIGWQQLYYGRMSLEFEAAQERHYRWIKAPEKTHTGRRWARLFIQQIWKTTIALWINRNKARHNNDDHNNAHTAQANLISRAEQCYADAHWLMATDRTKLFQKTLEERIKSDVKHLQAWVEGTEQIIRINKQEDPHILKCRKKMEEFIKKTKTAQ